jgi:hypothetical protein
MEALRIGFALLPVLAAAALANGCTKTACLEWSPDKGACPSREEALKRFGGQSCVADIIAVDSDAVADETACCYEVTERKAGQIGCGSASAGPSGGAAPPTGGGPCIGCAAFRAGESGDLCEPSVDILNDLVACLCSGPCAEACDDGSCSTSFETPECQACVADTENGCGKEMSACEGDI